MLCLCIAVCVRVCVCSSGLSTLGLSLTLIVAGSNFVLLVSILGGGEGSVLYSL